MSVTVEPDAGTAPAPAPASAAPAVSIEGLHKRFGRFVAVDDLSLEVPAGSVYGLIGPNGAGKTTTFAAVASLLEPDSGRVSVLGHDPVASPRQVRSLLGYMPDSLGVYGDLDVSEYLRFFAAAYRIPARSRSGLLDGLLELVALEGKRTARVDSLSRGMKQRLSLARALVHDPEVLILDEPASGLDPRARSELRALFGQLAEMGKTIVVSSHILSEIEDVCSHIAIMQSGRILASGLVAEVSGLLAGRRRLRARFADGTTEEHTADSAEEQAALLRRLANDDARALAEFSRIGGGLEETFLNLTREGDD